MNKNNLQECEIVQDLLPLYYDDACTPASRKLVEQHLQTCESCKKMYAELKNNIVGTVIKEEAAGVLKRHAKKERNAAYKAGVVIAFLLLLPVIITLLASMSSGDGLGVFAVVTASMLLIGAITVVPLVFSKKRVLKSILTGVTALLLIYFFVDQMNGGGEFILWSIPTIFGLSIVLFPFLIRSVSLPPVLSDKKALITLAWDTLWLFLTIVEVCDRSGDIEGMKTGFTVAIVLMSGVWLVFLVARYLPVNAGIKAGIITMIASIWTVFSNDVCAFLIEHKKQLTILAADFSDWSDKISYNANVLSIILAGGMVIGIILLVIGFVKRNHRKS